MRLLCLLRHSDDEGELMLWVQIEQAPGAGWVGAGLLGSVLAWLLLKHLPAKDAQLERLVDKFDAQLRETRSDFRASLKELVNAIKGRAE